MGGTCASKQCCCCCWTTRDDIVDDDPSDSGREEVVEDKENWVEAVGVFDPPLEETTVEVTVVVVLTEKLDNDVFTEEGPLT